MKRKHLLAAFLSILVTGGLVVVMADRPVLQENDPPINPNARIPIDNDCHAGCCQQSGGYVEVSSEGPVCHVDESSPYHDVQVSMFMSCANGC